MLERITINLSTDESLALQESARNNYRDLRSEARYLLRRQLEQIGALSLQKIETSNVEEQSTNRSLPFHLEK